MEGTVPCIGLVYRIHCWKTILTTMYYTSLSDALLIWQLPESDKIYLLVLVFKKQIHNELG